MKKNNTFLDKINRWFYKTQFGGKQRRRVYRKLASFLENGVPITQALGFMWDHQTNDGKKKNDPVGFILKEWRTRIENGYSLGEAMAGWVPDRDRITIDAGNQSGKLAKAMRDALFIHESATKIRNTIIGSMTYPIVLILMTVAFFIFISYSVLPVFTEALPMEKWTGDAANIAAVANFIKNWIVILGAAIAALVVAVIWSFPRWTGKWRVYFDKIPPWSIYRMNNGVGFMLSLSVLLSAGVKQPDILRSLAKGSSPWFKERMLATLRFLSNGDNIGLSLYKTQMGFPDLEMVKDLRSYASLSGFEAILEVLGRQWLTESIEKIEKQMSVIKTIAVLFMGSSFIFIINGLYAIYGQIASAANHF